MGNCNCKDLENHDKTRLQTEAFVNKKEIEAQSKEFCQRVVSDEYLSNISGHSSKQTLDTDRHKKEEFGKLNQNKSVYYVTF